LWFVDDAGVPPLLEGVGGRGRVGVDGPAVGEVGVDGDDGGVVFVEPRVVRA